MQTEEATAQLSSGARVDPLAVIRAHAESHRSLAASDAYSAQEAPKLEATLAAVAELVKAGTNAEEILKPCGIRTDSRRRHLASLVGLPWDAMADAIRNTARLRLRAALAPFSEAQS